MEMLVSAQWRALALALLFGVLSGVLYDVLRILRVLCGVHGMRRQPPHIPISLPLLPTDFFALRPEGKGMRIFHALLIFFGDVLWFLTVGVLFAVFVYWQNDGVFRLYMLCSAVLGFFIYYQTFGRLILLTAETVAGVLRIFLFYITLLLLLPFRFLYALGCRIAYFVCKTLVLPLYSARALRRRLRRTREGWELF